jgi:hypothetical protein
MRKMREGKRVRLSSRIGTDLGDWSEREVEIRCMAAPYLRI